VTFDDVILAGIMAMFAAFIVVLGGVSAWTWLAPKDGASKK